MCCSGQSGSSLGRSSSPWGGPVLVLSLSLSVASSVVVSWVVVWVGFRVGVGRSMVKRLWLPLPGVGLASPTRSPLCPPRRLA